MDGSRTSGVFSHSTSERALQALRTISATSFIAALRKGELCALKWANIDFQSETLSVNKSLGRLDGQAIEKKH